MNAETKPKATLLVQLPEGERGLPAHHIKRIDKLLRRVADLNRPKSERETARDTLREFEQGRRQVAEQDASDLRFAELEALERLRDPDSEEVVETRKSGGLRVLNRDGLETLLSAQSVSPLQYAAGMRYRDLFEATERSIKSNLDRSVGSGEDKRQLSDIGQKYQARKRLEMKVMEAARRVHKAPAEGGLKHSDGPNGRMLRTLREVAGEGRSITSISGGKSHNRKLNVEALADALDVCAKHWGMQ